MTSYHSESDSADATLRIDTRSLGRVPGAVMHVEHAAEVPEAVGGEMIRLPAGSDARLDLVLACVEEGILVTGTVTGRAELECARCLGHTSADVSIELSEMYAYPGSSAAGGVDSDEVRLADDDVVDLFPALVDGFGLEFPLNPTCEDYGEDDCVNPTTPAPDGVSGEEVPRIDPRFAELAERFGLDPDAPGEENG